MNGKKRFRRSNDRVIGGVCAGIAEYFDFDPTIVRVVYALLTFFTGFSGIPCYIILWIIMPSK
jgi:phage shock protein PspC (stress-responsive transcriptional regulator)